ncbi:LysR family transcriptional regulator [Limosilactobacillus reuteri]|uniref:LysR family transcriptional regulator n=2 Tax=Limosilactobacillus reuteri TaxID=1598 RepID=A0A256V9F0_LIMRT|nr:LysR family transcriptional regulator [Limosilactobacillus reuteri]OYS61428.1 LysR family transcriptional regulator [Limosilactobacillus reuteri]OYS62431.1 LysR family transcriptional regulator [Limosilactobacillus reuteri]OYS62723.1 LysR family transcriptional regulator [Limosilactobacillus reuteri]OYS68431.1 LysR family transcriptional regulator [Limosilactobacillus reuteri]OYS77109.1 LysR family transcriptional regulator [Limosilactobacillus reuteri]
MFQQMKYFIAVVDEHSFTRAAEKCNISQSAISQQIKELNQTVGTPLLKRQGRSFELTPAGNYFYRQAKTMVSQIEQVLKNTRQIADNEQEEYVLKLGYLQMFGTTEFLKAVTIFAEQYPEVKVNITSGQHDHLFKLLRDDRIDLDFSDQRRALFDEYNNEFLTKAPLMVNIAKGLLKLNDSQVTTDQLKDIPCILVAPDASEEQYCRDVLGIKRYILNPHPERARPNN